MDNNYNQQTNEYYNPQGNPYQQPTPNIFQQFYLSFVPPQYSRLTKVKTGSMIGFVTLLAFISTVFIFAYLMIAFRTINLDMLPDFEIREGQLNIEEDFIYDEAIIYIHMTDDVSEFFYEDAYELAVEGYFNVILVGRDRISMMQNGQYQQFNFSELGSSMVIDKDLVVTTFISFVRVFFVMGFVIFFVGRVFWYFLCAAVYMLFAMLIASIMKKQLSAGTLFRVAVYSKVMMFVAATFLIVVSLAGLSVPFLLRVAITIVFMWFAIAKLTEEGWR